jgi:hypothetical protein
VRASIFFTDTVEYLGHIMGPDSIKPNPTLVKAIIEFPQPHTLKELQSFIGLANYYHKFIENYSKIALSFDERTSSPVSPAITNVAAMSHASSSDDDDLGNGNGNGWPTRDNVR